MLKTLIIRTVLNIFVETTFFRIFWWIETSKEHNLFDYFIYLFILEFFCNGVSSDEFNASLLNKSTNYWSQIFNIIVLISKSEPTNLSMALWNINV